MPLLSICIPTYNRVNLITDLVKSILDNDLDIELCVHIDGSTDSTLQELSALKDERLILSNSSNNGRALALKKCLSNSSGQYVMFYDDDDLLDTSDLKKIYNVLVNNKLEKCFIFHMNDEKLDRIGTLFNTVKSNFISLRADYKVLGDKKEIIESSILKKAFEYTIKTRRVPTSLYWSIISLNHEALCVEESIGIKRYKLGGMTNNIKKLKIQNSNAMTDLYKILISAYFKKRYYSKIFFAKSIIAYLYYVTLSIAIND